MGIEDYKKINNQFSKIGPHTLVHYPNWDICT